MLPNHNCANGTGDIARALCLLAVLAMGCSNAPTAEKVNVARDPVDFAVAPKTNDKSMAPTGVSVTDLRCEYLMDPLGIDTQIPRFSWRLVDPRRTRGQQQTAYRILVEGDGSDGSQTKTVLWDSGKVASAESVNRAYAGAELTSGRDCTWKVRVWDKDGSATDWSPTARWRCSSRCH